MNAICLLVIRLPEQPSRHTEQEKWQDKTLQHPILALSRKENLLSNTAILDRSGSTTKNTIDTMVNGIQSLLATMRSAIKNSTSLARSHCLLVFDPTGISHGIPRGSSKKKLTKSVPSFIFPVQLSGYKVFINCCSWIDMLFLVLLTHTCIANSCLLAPFSYIPKGQNIDSYCWFS